MLIYDTLKKEHREVQYLLNQLVALDEKSTTRRDELVQKIHDALIPHSKAEEAVLYNPLRSYTNDNQKDILHGYEEHMEAENLLRLLQVKDKIGGNWKQTASKLKTAIDHHIAEEEEKIFSLAHQVFTEHEAEIMTTAFERLKPEVENGNFMQSVMDIAANFVPTRLAASMRNYNLKPENPETRRL